MWISRWIAKSPPRGEHFVGEKYRTRTTSFSISPPREESNGGSISLRRGDVIRALLEPLLPAPRDHPVK